MDDLFGSTQESTVPVASNNINAFADPAADFIANSDADLKEIENSSAPEISTESAVENESAEAFDDESKKELAETEKLEKWEIEQKDRISKMGSLFLTLINKNLFETKSEIILGN